MLKPLQEIYVTLFICPPTHLVKKWHSVNAVCVQGGCKRQFFFLCSLLQKLYFVVSCGSTCETHKLKHLHIQSEDARGQ